jgi:catechol 2,3-dioxygenase-like lactoylglutathione lyase family enzyme
LCETPALRKIYIVIFYSPMTSIPRRSFVAITGAALVAPSMPLGRQRPQSDVPPLVDQVPAMLDHILLGCNDLQRGIDFVEQHTGVRAAFGGVHPGRGTQNALLSLGSPSVTPDKGHYLEIIAPDPNQTASNELANLLKKLSEPHLVGWAAHPGDIQVRADDLAKAGITAEGPTPGSRKRPDGSVLHWKTLRLKDDANGLLPFFIEWSVDSPHPSADAPSGCQLLRFELLTPDPAALAKITTQLKLKVPIAKGTCPQLHAVIKGPEGELSLAS